MIPLGDIKYYQFVEVEGKWGYSFKQSPAIPITDDNREMVEQFHADRTLKIHSKESGTESEYKIIDVNIQFSDEYADGLLVLSVRRCVQDMTISPTGSYREEQRKNGKIVDWNMTDIISVQPMSQPSGLVFYMDFKYGTGSKAVVKSP